MSDIGRRQFSLISAMCFLLVAPPISTQERAKLTKTIVHEIRFFGDDEVARAHQSEFDGLEHEDFGTGYSAVEELQDRVQWLYQSNGYYKAQVKAYPHSLSGSSNEQPLSVDVQIAQNLQYRLRRLEFTGQKVFSAEQLRTLFPIQSGEVFNVEKVREGLDNLRKHYGEYGYINMTPVPDTKADDPQAVVDLSIDVDEGPQFRIGTIGFSGTGARDSSFQEKVLKSLTFKPGDVYNSHLLEEFFNQNRSWLPPDSNPEDDLEIAQDTREHTVDLYFVFK